jgi:hypothetical protein
VTLVGYYRAGEVTVVKLFGFPIFFRVGRQWKLRWFYESAVEK